MRGAGRSAARQAGTPPPSTGMRKPENFFIHALSAASIIPGIALTGTWCAPGIREGGGAGPVAWRKRGWKFSSEARARFAAPPHRQRPPRGPRRSGKTTGGGEERSTAGRRKANDLAFRARNARSHSGGLGRRHTFTLRGADPAPRFPTAPDRESSLTMARPETGRGNEEACLLTCRGLRSRGALMENPPATGKSVKSSSLP